MNSAVAAALWAIVAIVLVVAVFRKRRSGTRMRVGPGAAGTIYDMLNEDKRKAVEIIVEHRAEARDPEDRDGNLPDLAGPPKQ
jgi:hypothetical protein